jgi:hypothetical protein
METIKSTLTAKQKKDNTIGMVTFFEPLIEKLNEVKESELIETIECIQRVITYKNLYDNKLQFLKLMEGDDLYANHLNGKFSIDEQRKEAAERKDALNVRIEDLKKSIEALKF